MKLRRVRITENSEQDTAEFVILPGLREQARRGGIRRLTALESDRRKIEETYLKAVDIGYSYRLAKKMEEFKSNPVLGYRTAGSKAEFDTGEFLKEEIKEFVDGHYGMPDTERLFPVVQEAVQHKMKRQIELAGVKKIRVHDIRHSHVAYLIEKGVEPLLIRDRLGHKDIRITLNTYGHLYPNQQRKIANLLDNENGNAVTGLGEERDEC